jgi:serine/threonine protein kinase
MMKNSHGLPVDWWSLGCILFEMVTGEAPFGDIESLSKFEIFNNINEKNVHLPMSSSAPLKDLVKGLLCKDSHGRMSKKEVMKAPWVSDIDWRLVSSKKYAVPWLPAGRTSYNTTNYLDWPKESLAHLKAPTPEEAGYSSSLLLPLGTSSGLKSSGGQAGEGAHRKASSASVSSASKKHGGVPMRKAASVHNMESHHQQHQQHEQKPAKAGAGRKSLNKQVHAHAHDEAHKSSSAGKSAESDKKEEGEHAHAHKSSTVKHRKSSVKVNKCHAHHKKH